jgi:hypothetical protein
MRRLPTAPLREGLRTRLTPLAMAFAAAGVAVGALLYVSYATDHTVRSSEDITELGVPVLAFMPDFDSRETRPWVMRRLVKRDRAFARRVAADLPANLERSA